MKRRALVRHLENHGCELLGEGGTIQCWGKNSVGQLGNGTRTHSSTPVPVKGITNATAVATGVDHSCAVLSDHTIWCWGNNNIGQLGNGIAIPSGSRLPPLDDSEPGYKPIPTPEPVQVSNITTAMAVSAGNYYGCAVLSDGTIWCWGSNSSGKLGNGTAAPFPSSSTPVKVNGIPARATAVATGYGTESFGHTCALLQNGTIWCWGDNRNGELGNGTAAPDYLPTPVKVSTITTATAVALGIEHSCALLGNGTISCWGNNTQGQLGNPSIPRGNNRIAVEPTLPVLGIP